VYLFLISIKGKKYLHKSKDCSGIFIYICGQICFMSKKFRLSKEDQGVANMMAYNGILPTPENVKQVKEGFIASMSKIYSEYLTPEVLAEMKDSIKSKK